MRAPRLSSSSLLMGLGLFGALGAWVTSRVRGRGRVARQPVNKYAAVGVASKLNIRRASSLRKHYCISAVTTSNFNRTCSTFFEGHIYEPFVCSISSR